MQSIIRVPVLQHPLLIHQRRMEVGQDRIADVVRPDLVGRAVMKQPGQLIAEGGAWRQFRPQRGPFSARLSLAHCVPATNGKLLCRKKMYRPMGNPAYHEWSRTTALPQGVHT